MKSPWVLVVAGVDSSASAGVAADREALDHLGLGSHSVATVWTGQTGEGVQSYSPLAAQDWLAVAQTELDREPSALKFGLLPGADHVRAAASLSRVALERGIPVVLDPVIGSSSGFVFLDAAAIQTLRDELLSQALVLTPNLLECPQLCGRRQSEVPMSPEQRLGMAEQILAQGPRAVLLKGGHGQEDPVCDLILERGQEPRWHRHGRQVGRSIGGSGCRYASAVAGALALGQGLYAAAQGAGAYVAGLIGKN